MARTGRKPLLGDRAMTPAERQRRRREKLARQANQPATLARRIWARLSTLELNQAKRVHAELLKLIRQAEKDGSS